MTWVSFSEGVIIIVILLRVFVAAIRFYLCSELVVLRVNVGLILLSVPSWLWSSTVVSCNLGICDI